MATRGPLPDLAQLPRNHMSETTAVGMFVVATATFRLLYAVIILGHNRRKVIHFDVTQNPTQIWLAHQMTEAFPWDTAPRYLLRDRDTSYGQVFRNRLQAMGIKEVVTAARSPWQNAYVERIIGSVRRECLNHVIIFDERHLRGVLSSYFRYYHKTRTHLSLDKDCPESRTVHLPAVGKIIAFPEVGGLHHRYERGCLNSCSYRTDPPISVLRVIPLCNAAYECNAVRLDSGAQLAPATPNVPFG